MLVKLSEHSEYQAEELEQDLISVVCELSQVIMLHRQAGDRFKQYNQSKIDRFELQEADAGLRAYLQEQRVYHYSDLAELIADMPQASKIKAAYEFAELAHRPQKRKSGEPYIHHPIAVAMLIAKLKLDSKSN